MKTIAKYDYDVRIRIQLADVGFFPTNPDSTTSVAYRKYKAPLDRFVARTLSMLDEASEDHAQEKLTELLPFDSHVGAIFVNLIDRTINLVVTSFLNVLDEHAGEQLLDSLSDAIVRELMVGYYS